VVLVKLAGVAAAVRNVGDLATVTGPAHFWNLSALRQADTLANSPDVVAFLREMARVGLVNTKGLTHADNDGRGSAFND